MKRFFLAALAVISLATAIDAAQVVVGNDTLYVYGIREPGQLENSASGELIRVETKLIALKAPVFIIAELDSIPGIDTVEVPLNASSLPARQAIFSAGILSPGGADSSFFAMITEHLWYEAALDTVIDVGGDPGGMNDVERIIVDPGAYVRSSYRAVRPVGPERRLVESALSDSLAGVIAGADPTLGMTPTVQRMRQAGASFFQQWRAQRFRSMVTRAQYEALNEQ